MELTAEQLPPLDGLPGADGGATTVRDVVDRIIELVDAVSDLLSYEGLKELIQSLAEELGFTDQLIDMLEAIAGFIERIINGLDRLKEPLRHLEAMAGLMGLLTPLVGALGDVLTTTLEQLTAAVEDFGADLEVPSGVGDALTTAENAVASVGDYLDEQPPTEEQLDELIDRLRTLNGELLDLGNFEEAA